MLRYYIAVHYSFETFSKRTSAPRAQIDRCSGFGWHGSFENNSTAPIQRLHQKEPRYTSQISFLWSNSSWAPDLLPPSQWLLTVESITIRPKNYMHQVTSRSVSQTLIDHPSWNGFHKKKGKQRDTVWLFNNRLLPTRLRVFTLKKKRTELCQYCKKREENDEHLTIMCEKKRPLIRWFQRKLRWLQCPTRLRASLSVPYR